MFFLSLLFLSNVCFVVLIFDFDFAVAVCISAHVGESNGVLQDEFVS